MDRHMMDSGGGYPKAEELYTITAEELAADFETITAQLHERGGAIRIQCEGRGDMVLFDIDDYFRWSGATAEEIKAVREACRNYKES